MRVKPIDPNAVIRDPLTKRRLPPEGGDVQDNVFWRRRLLAKEIELVVDTVPAGAPPVKPDTKSA